MYSLNFYSTKTGKSTNSGSAGWRQSRLSSISAMLMMLIIVGFSFDATAQVDCSASDLEVTLSSDPTAASTPGMSICPCVPGNDPASTTDDIGTVLLQASVTGGVSGYAYEWSTGGNSVDQRVCPTGSTQYSVTVTDNEGCTASATIMINVDDDLSAEISSLESSGNLFNDFTICSGEFINLSVPNNASYSYEWAPGGETTNNISVSPATATTYRVTVSNGIGCEASSSVTVNVNPNPISNGGADQSICAGGMTNLAAAAAAGGVSPYTYEWSSNSGTFMDDSSLSAPGYSNDNAGTTAVLTLTVRDANGCEASDDVLVSVFQDPTIDLALAIEPFCYDGINDVPVIITNNDDQAGYTYDWFFDSAMTMMVTNAQDQGDGNAANESIQLDLDPMDNGFYYVEVTDGNGCIAIDSIEVEIFNGPSVPDVLNGDTDEMYGLCLGCSITVPCNATFGSSTTANSESWIEVDNAGNPVASPTAGITATNTDGCNLNLTSDGSFTGMTFWRYTIEDANGCTATGVKGVMVGNAFGPIVRSESVCGTDELTLVADTRGICGELTYAWSIPGAAPSAVSAFTDQDSYTVQMPANTAAGQVNLTISNDSGCSISFQYDINSVQVFEKMLNVCNAGDDQSFATNANPENGTLLDFEACVTNAGLPTDGVWSENSTSTIDIADVNDNPGMVDFWGVEPGMYEWIYTFEDDGIQCVSSIQVNVTSCFDLALTKQVCDVTRGGTSVGFAPGTAYMPGDIVTYAITIFNQGSVNAQNIVVNDYMPVAMNFLDGSGAACGSGTATPWAADPASPPIPFTNNFMTSAVINVGAGAATVIYIRAQIDANASAAFILNNAEITDFEDASGMMPMDEDDLFGSGAGNPMEEDDDVNDAPDNPDDDDQFDGAEVEVMCQDDPFACNDHIQVSLDADCRALITPDMVLEDDMGPNCGYDIELIDEATGQVLASSPFVTSANIGDTIRVNVSSMGMNRNSCWGYVFVEDKLAPKLSMCLDDITVGCNEVFDLDHADTSTEIDVTVDATCPATDQNGATDDMTPVMINNTAQEWQEFQIKVENPCQQFDFVQDISITFDGNLTNFSEYEFELIGPSTTSFSGTYTAINSNGINDVSLLDGMQATNANIEGTYSIRVREEAAFVGNATQLFIDNITMTINCSSFVFSPPLDDPEDCDPGTIIIHSDTFDEDFEECADDEFSAKRNILYSLVDSEGNVGARPGGLPANDTCTLMIFYRRTDNSDIVAPPNWTGVNGQNPVLDCDGEYANPSPPPTDIVWDANENGYPDPEEVGVPTVDGNPIFPNPVGVCEIQADYEDQILPGDCPNNYKILRRWVILNWCESSANPDNPRMIFQTIKVRDDEGPVITAPQDLTGMATVLTNDPYSCEADVMIAPPTFISDCSSYTYQIGVKLADEDGLPPPDTDFDMLPDVYGPNEPAILNDIPGGRTWIRYTATDECGNTSEAFTELDVFDGTPPTPICDEYTVVPLNADNQAKIFAESFDDGSYDACGGPLTYLVRRYNTPNCDGSPVVYDDHVKFCCADVGQDIMVALQVSDQAGNSNICMVTVNVQDKNASSWSYCPPDLVIDCLDDTDVASTGGPAEAVDNCNILTVTSTDNADVNNCGVGTIIRTWTATNPAGEVVLSKNQFITVSDLTPFAGPVWPRTPVNINGCQSVDTDPSNTGEPNVGSGDMCSLIASTFEDQVFEFAEDACFKILRYWTVIDWCIYDGTTPTGDPANPFPGMWKTTQVIKVDNSVRPTFAAGCMTSVVNGETGLCSADVSLSADVSDDCTAREDLIVTLMIDYFSDGSFDVSDSGLTYRDGEMPLGKHLIKWTAEDRCGNVSECEVELDVEDQKAPSPYCYGGTTTVLMENTGSVEVWANDFDLGSTDNCPSPLTFTMRPKGSTADPTPSFLFDCSYANEVVEVEMHVTDVFGNSDFCFTFVRIQDNSGACGGSSFGNISGVIHTEDDHMVSDVSVTLDNMTSYSQATDMTNDSGSYEFADVLMYSDYEISAKKDDNPLNGVSTLDLVKIQRHILEITALDSPYKVIAADVNNNQDVSAADLVELRRLILGIQSDFNNSDSWRFVEEGQSFAVMNAPWPFNEILSLLDFDQDSATENFIAVKVGDVSGDAVANIMSETEVRSSAVLGLSANATLADTDGTLRIPVTADEVSVLSGIQMGLSWSADKMSLLDVESGAMKLTAANTNRTNAESGQLAISWNADQSDIRVDAGTVLFTLVFGDASGVAAADELQIAEGQILAEAYTSALDVRPVTLTVRSERIATVDADVVLYQNRPNPFSENTIIDFSLPKRGPVSLKVFNTDGKMIWNTERIYEAGLNSIEISQDALPATGILYYELESGGQSYTKKMMKIK